MFYMRSNIIDLTSLEKLFYIDSEYVLRWKLKRNGTNGIGSIAGYVSSSGYLRLEINSKQYTIHRIIYQMVNKIERLDPNLEIDHIDCNKTNNNPNNLRISTGKENSRNRPLRKDSTSKLKGVTKNRNNWRARIIFDGKCVNLGVYDTPELAHLAYIKASKEYHAEFGRFE